MDVSKFQRPEWEKDYQATESGSWYSDKELRRSAVRESRLRKGKLIAVQLFLPKQNSGACACLCAYVQKKDGTVVPVNIAI